MLSRLIRWCQFDTDVLLGSTAQRARLLTALALLLAAEWPDVRPYAGFTAELADPPPGTSAVVSLLFPLGETVTSLFNVLGVFLLVGFALTRRPRLLAIIFGAWAVFAHSVVFSTGKIDHTFLPWFIPLLAWGFVKRADGTGETADRSLVALALSAAWVTAAGPKLLGGWLDADSQSVANAVVASDLGLLTIPIERIPTLLTEVVDWGVVFGELTLAVAFLVPRLRKLGTLTAIAFHISVVVLLGITYESIVPIYLFLALPPSLLPSSLLRPKTRDAGSMPAPPVIATLVVAGIWRALSSSSNLVQAASSRQLQMISSIIFLAAVAVVALGARRPTTERALPSDPPAPTGRAPSPA